MSGYLNAIQMADVLIAEHTVQLHSGGSVCLIPPEEEGVEHVALLEIEIDDLRRIVAAWDALFAEGGDPA